MPLQKNQTVSTESRSSLSAHSLEAVLYAHGGTLSMRELSSMFGCDTATLLQSLDLLEQSLEGHGISLYRTADQVSLRTAVAETPFIAQIFADKVGKDIGPAGLEVAAILLYRGPSTRSFIDHVRGVNSTSALRQLSMRGLIQRLKDDSGREHVYTPTPDMLAHLGIVKPSSLAAYDTIRLAFEEYGRTRETTSHATSSTDEQSVVQSESTE